MDSTKLKYILERASKDESIEQGERLQRNELSPQEAEAMRTDTSTAVLYELYRPLDDIEKRRLLSGKSRSLRGRVAGGFAAAVAAAAVLVTIAVQKPLQPAAGQLLVQSDVSGSGREPHMLGGGSPEPIQKTIIDIGGCTRTGLVPRDPESRFSEDTQVMAFFHRGSELVPWPTEFQYKAGQLQTRDVCASVPTAGLREGDWQLIVIYGHSLPRPEQAASALQSWTMPWTRWSVARTEVRLQQRANHE